MKRMSRLLHPAILLLAAVGTAPAADISDFLNPNGAVWGVLIESNATATSVAAIPDGFVVAGTQYAEVPENPGIDSWAALAQLDEDGALGPLTRFDAEADHNMARSVIPLLSNGDSLDGFVFAGSKHHFDLDPVNPSVEWYVPWMWVVKTDATFARQWETQLGAVTHQTEGHVVVREPLGFLVGGAHFFAPGASSGADEWVVRLTKGGGFSEEAYFGTGEDDGVFDIAPTTPPGFVFATARGIVKTDALLNSQWRAGNEPPDEGLLPDAYRAVAQASDGGYFAVGNRTGTGSGDGRFPDLVLTKFDAAGAMDWQRVWGDVGTASDVGRDVAATPDGGCVVVGSSASRGHGGSDIWVIKAAPDGGIEWDLCLGAEGSHYGYSIALASDGNYVVAGSADVDGVHSMWVVKVRSDLHAPVPVFTVTPASPLFRDQEATFDASESTAPGSTIASYDWDFDDGDVGSGTVIQHTYHASGVYDIILTLTNDDGVSRSATNQVEVTGLALQWERFLGVSEYYTASSLVEARDGGFVLTGGNDSDLWVLKTDSRGRPVWQRFFDHELVGTQQGHVVIRGHDTGYVVAGTDYHYSTYWYQDAWLLKVDEDGELAWPEIRVFGETNRHEQAWCVAATDDGGYIVIGERMPPGEWVDTRLPWLIKTDGDGIEQWTQHYESEGWCVGTWVAAAADSGYVFTTETSARPFFVFKTDSAGVETWREEFSQYDRGLWIGERGDPATGYAMVGVSNRDISLRFLDEMGIEVDNNLWTGTEATTRSDYGNHAVRTLNGGYLITGYVNLPKSGTSGSNNELALVKTDAEGNEHWVEFMPGTIDVHEYGLAALAEGSYVVLGKHSARDRFPVWLFKLAANRPPDADIQIDPQITRPGVLVSFDGSLSTDRDGAVMSHEWDFGHGETDVGAGVTHAFDGSGMYTVWLTAVDDQDAEGSITGAVTVAGVECVDAGLVVSEFTITECAACEPENYHPDGAPAIVDWETARGFRLQGSAPSSTSRAILATFSETLPDDFTLYLLPLWEPVSYTVLDAYTLEVRLWIPHGDVDLAFVLAGAIPAPAIADCRLVPGPRLALTFATMAGYDYSARRTPQLMPPDWVDVLHAVTPEGPADLDTLAGTGAEATVYVDLPEGSSAFFQVGMERHTP